MLAIWIIHAELVSHSQLTQWYQRHQWCCCEIDVCSNQACKGNYAFVSPLNVCEPSMPLTTHNSIVCQTQHFHPTRHNEEATQCTSPEGVGNPKHASHNTCASPLPANNTLYAPFTLSVVSPHQALTKIAVIFTVYVTLHPSLFVRQRTWLSVTQSAKAVNSFPDRNASSWPAVCTAYRAHNCRTVITTSGLSHSVNHTGL
jgi:hypothetical protein